MSSQESIKVVVSNITVVDNGTAEIDDGEYYLFLALLNGSTDTTSPNKAGQGDEDSITMDPGGKEAEEDSEQGVSLSLRSVLLIFRYLVLCFKIILGIWYHTFYDFEVYWYLVGNIQVCWYPTTPPDGPDN